ncbi:TPR repeat protein [Pseudomonas sp. ADAK2 TE3594]
MAKTNIERFALVFLVFCTASANAENFKVSPKSEALYFKALPYLEEIDKEDNEFFKKHHQRAAEVKPSEEQKKQYRERLQSLLNEGIPLIKQSADEGNPAAQYRLAWISSRFDPRDQVANKVCALLKTSLSHGFTPAGLQMISYCFDYVETAEFRSLIDALPNAENLYGKYYPQPTMLPSCDRLHGSQDNDVIVSLDEKGIRANLYMSVATQMSRQSLKQENLRYLQKAAQYGCNTAIERLKTSTGS